jgi:hypothetical protein
MSPLPADHYVLNSFRNSVKFASPVDSDPCRSIDSDHLDFLAINKVN